MNRLDGKVALISGAARGIGAETARLMIEAGAKVAIGDVLDERGQATVRALDQTGGAALYTHLDVTREEDWNTALAAAVGRFGGLDILVNNAGVFLGMSIEEASLADWQRLCGVNLTGGNLGTNDIEEARRQALARLPIGRMGTVTDIAKGIVFLASDDAGFMTGASLVVDGGITAQ